MKRDIYSSIASSSHNRSSFALQPVFNQLTASLPELDRFELFNFLENARNLVEECERSILMERYRVMTGVVDDVWKIIFASLQENVSNIEVEKSFIVREAKGMEKEFQMLSCVSKSFSKMVPEIIRESLPNFPLTNWVINHCSGIEDIEVLDLSSNSSVTNESLMRFTNLTVLNLSGNPKISAAIEKLTNLTELDLSANRVVPENSLLKLSNLISLSLHANSVISDRCLMKMSNLETLNLRYNATITNKGIENLVNLKKISFLFSPLFPSPLSNVCLQKLTNLTDLDVVGPNLANDAITHLVNLRSLHVGGRSVISYQGFSHLSNLSTLKIMFSGNLVDDELKRMTNLTSLEIERT